MRLSLCHCLPWYIPEAAAGVAIAPRATCQGRESVENAVKSEREMERVEIAVKRENGRGGDGEGDGDDMDEGWGEVEGVGTIRGSVT